MFQLCMQKVDLPYLELSTSTPSFFLLLSAFQPHLQTPKWFWQLEECTNTTAITFEVITKIVYYFQFGRSFEGWGTFPMAISWVAVWTMTVVEMSAAISLDPHEQKPLSPRELASHRLPAAFKFGYKKAFEQFCSDSWMWPSFLAASRGYFSEVAETENTDIYMKMAIIGN